jgi:hypothetical protein
MKTLVHRVLQSRLHLMTLRQVATKFIVSVLALFVVANTASAASYQISVNTSDIGGLTGYLDLQLNPADGSTPQALATISLLNGDIGFIAPPELTGNVSGALPGSVFLTNSTPYNDYFHAIQFGSTFSFTLTLDGDFLNQPSTTGTSFAISLYAQNGVGEFIPLLTTDPAGTLVRFELANQGITYTTFDDGSGHYAAQVTPPVPVPAAIWLLVSGLAGVVGMGRRHATATVIKT